MGNAKVFGWTTRGGKRFFRSDADTGVRDIPPKSEFGVMKIIAADHSSETIIDLEVLHLPKSMQELDLVDHSPHQPTARPPLATASNLILIDNYDSFTWNVYQYLVLEGATVTVFRNDEITVNELEKKNPTQLVISPGPGHPDTDGGISNEAILRFAGKIPVLGVCLGEQAMFSVFGGKVDVTGEILHGKTSLLHHDGKGVYAGLPQDLPVTRYHSLAGTHPTLPDCLELSSWTRLGADEEKIVVMGVRHKKYVIEGVQFHPESILTAEGRPMLRNFLQMRGGTWEENAQHNNVKPRSSYSNGVGDSSNGLLSEGKAASILDKIYSRRRELVAAQKELPSQTPADFEAAYRLNLAPPQISFVQRLRQSSYPLSLMAEIKRASPSKGLISISACAPEQARRYALAGASVISVLTEPEWFKGSIEDLRTVRQSLEGMPNRPAVLRKEFIFDEYQILEARLAGADTVLLIVKMLDDDLLKRLYRYSLSLGMEPLVEVNTAQEMQAAVKLGAKVIGVNNRNLTNFEVDLETTSKLSSLVRQGTIVCALSGISSPKDVEPYLKIGVGAVLVGEALMRARNCAAFIAELLSGGEMQAPKPTKRNMLVKICGTRSANAAKAAIEAGADLIGIILVTGRKRCVSPKTALEISRTVHTVAKPISPGVKNIMDSVKAISPFEYSSGHLTHPQRALLVGVFYDQPLEYVLEQQKLLSLDVIQLHGSEPIEWASLLPVPVIKSFKPTDSGVGRAGYHALPLLDSGCGGSGRQLNMSEVQTCLKGNPDVRVLLAGGLDADNVAEALRSLDDLEDRVLGVDVSSGVDSDGEQSLEKIKGFVAAAKSIR